MEFQTFSEGKGRREGRAVQEVTVFNDVTSHHHPSAYLVWLCTHCPRSIWPIQSQRSCILVHSPLGCLLTADLCGCNSCVQCKPFLQQPVEVERMEHITPWLDLFTHHYIKGGNQGTMGPTCAAISTRFGNFRALPSPSFKKSSKLPMKKT